TAAPHIYTLSLHDALPICPAMTEKCPPPKAAPPTFTTVSSGWNLRFAFLYGSETRFTSSTAALARTRSTSTALVSPISPTRWVRSEEHTSELQSRFDLVCR